LSIPLRAAFLPFRSTFDSFLEKNDVAHIGEREGGTWVGLWHISEAAVDERGGTYLLTARTSGVLTSEYHGFAFRPNRHGSPYADEDYQLRHLCGDWYEFYAIID